MRIYSYAEIQNFGVFRKIIAPDGKMLESAVYCDCFTIFIVFVQQLYNGGCLLFCRFRENLEMINVVAIGPVAGRLSGSPISGEA